MTRSGSSDWMISTFGSTRPPILGMACASGGQSQKRVTPTTRPPRPRAKRISVMFGAMETIRPRRRGGKRERPAEVVLDDLLAGGGTIGDISREYASPDFAAQKECRRRRIAVKPRWSGPEHGPPSRFQLLTRSTLPPAERDLRQARRAFWRMSTSAPKMRRMFSAVTVSAGVPSAAMAPSLRKTSRSA